MPTIPPAGYEFAHRLMRLRWRLIPTRTLGVKIVATYADHVVLVRHHYGDRRWMLPGGGMKRTEQVHGAARRELHEETGCDIGPNEERIEVIGVFESTLEHKNDLVIGVAVALDQRPTLVARHEVAEAILAPLDALPDGLSSSTRAVLARRDEPRQRLGHWGA